MRRDSKNNTREAKEIARRKYVERQIEKWWKWSWNTHGKIKYKDLVEQQDKYGIICT
jgi:hypothetical protein